MLVQINESGTNNESFGIDCSAALDRTRGDLLNFAIEDSHIADAVQTRLGIHHSALENDEIEIGGRDERLCVCNVQEERESPNRLSKERRLGGG